MSIMSTNLSSEAWNIRQILELNLLTPSREGEVKESTQALMD